MCQRASVWLLLYDLGQVTYPLCMSVSSLNKTGLLVPQCQRMDESTFKVFVTDFYYIVGARQMLGIISTSFPLLKKWNCWDKIIHIFLAIGYKVAVQECLSTIRIWEFLLVQIHPNLNIIIITSTSTVFNCISFVCMQNHKFWSEIKWTKN